MIAKTKGIILRSVKYSETSLILDIFTKELGLKTYIISGVRKKNARTSAGTLQLMSIVDLVIYDKDSNKINRIKEAKPAYIYKQLPFDIKKSSVALFIIEIMGKSIKEKEPNPEFFEFIENSLIFLDQTIKNISNFHLVFLLKASKFLGFYPKDNYSKSNIYFDKREGHFTEIKPEHEDFLDEQKSIILHKIINTDLEHCDELILTREDRNALLENMILYYKIHLTDFGKIKTLEVFKSVFAKI